MSTVITHKQFPNHRTYTMDLCGRPLTIDVGKVAELATASAMVSYGETTVLVAVTAAPRPRDGVDFFPLSVDFEEKLYAVGRIPGSFMRREGQPSLPAVLAARVIDRSIRPLFPYDFRNDVVVTCTVMSVDRDCSPEAAAMVGVSACLADVYKRQLQDHGVDLFHRDALVDELVGVFLPVVVVLVQID